MKSAAPLALFGFLAFAGPSHAVELPQQVTAPPDRPQAPQPAPAEPPVPTPSPEAPPSDTAPVPDERPPEADAPLPEPRPTPPPADPADMLRQPPPELGGPGTGAGMPPEETACRAGLAALGARFRELPPVRETAGCVMPHPLVVTRLTTRIDIAPEITINCATALATAKFAKEVMSPAAEKAFGSAIGSISQASGYVCRPRNGTQKLSEHAFGNAIDIASFALANEKTIAVEPAPPPENEKFLREVRDAACGPFKTVLGPGSDADHSLHLHFDLAQRRNGGTFCQ
jgi:hypothetical protein